MLADIRIATIVGLIAVFVLVNAAEQKTPQVKETKRLFWGWKHKPKHRPKPQQSCGTKPPGRNWANDWDGRMDFSCPQRK